MIVAMAGSRIQDEEMADAPAERPARLRSTITAVRKQKGRGFRDDMEIDDDRRGSQNYESLDTISRSKGGAKCRSLFEGLGRYVGVHDAEKGHIHSVHVS